MDCHTFKSKLTDFKGKICFIEVQNSATMHILIRWWFFHPGLVGAG